MSEHKECPTCICGKRAPVQRGGAKIVNGTIAWVEHLEAFDGYAARYGTQQSAERIAERGGFGYDELLLYLKRAPTTWEPRR